MCVLFALMAAPAGAAPIFSLSDANPLNVLAEGTPVASKPDASTLRDELAAVGPRRDAQPPFLAWPSRGRLESPFGSRWGRVHEGLDIDGETGDPVTAAERGTVVLAEFDQGYGLTVEVAHSGRFSGLSTRYSHLSAAAVESGEFVERGERVGRIGTTGFVTGSHLHFELHDADGPFDPVDLLVPRDDSN
jgi:murein DD-endopeptidase MepM/ murein hydrolase activator NlpD